MFLIATYFYSSTRSYCLALPPSLGADSSRSTFLENNWKFKAPDCKSRAAQLSAARRVNSDIPIAPSLNVEKIKVIIYQIYTKISIRVYPVSFSICRWNVYSNFHSSRAYPVAPATSRFPV